jgi:CheY-like chemotaxis protein
VVDDDQAACNFIRDVLAHSTSMEVLALTDGNAAIQALRDEKFAVVVLDQHMPPPDGFELAKMTRKGGLNQMTPIIMISDDEGTAAVSQGFAAGAQFFLYKPIDKMRLLRLVRATHGAIEHERRRFRRVTLQTRVRLHFDKTELDGQTIDLSLDGMLVQASGSCPPDSPVRVSLFVPQRGEADLLHRLGRAVAQRQPPRHPAAPTAARRRQPAARFPPAHHQPGRKSRHRGRAHQNLIRLCRVL